MTDREETYLLAAVMFAFALLVLWCEHHFKDDAQIFQVFASVIAGASGALFTKLKGAGSPAQPKEDKTPDA